MSDCAEARKCLTSMAKNNASRALDVLKLSTIIESKVGNMGQPIGPEEPAKSSPDRTSLVAFEDLTDQALSAALATLERINRVL